MMNGQKESVFGIDHRNSSAHQIAFCRSSQDLFRTQTGASHFPMQVDLATLLSVNRHRLVAGETGGFLHETEVLGESLRALPLETLPSQAGEGVRHVFLQCQDASIL